MFEDEQRREERQRRDPVLPAEPSAAAEAKKKRSHQTAEGFPVHSFCTLLPELASRARVGYEVQYGDRKLLLKQEPKPWTCPHF